MYKNGWDKQKIVDFFAILDWLMQLAPADTLEFNQQLVEIEGTAEMQYVTSVERIGIVKGLFQGIEKGREEGREDTLRQNIIKMRNKLNLTTEKIAEVLEVPVEKINYLLSQSKSQ